MSDERQFPIKITVDTSDLVVGGKAGAQSLKEMESAGKDCASGLEESAKAADKATVAKKDLKGMVKGLKEEFPELAHVAKLALNPIAFVVAGIGAAWAIWTERVKQATEVLAGLELPDNKAMEPGHIFAAAAAWEKYADAVSAAARKLNSIEEESGRVFKQLDAALARVKALESAEAGSRAAQIAGMPEGPAKEKAKMAEAVRVAEEKRQADFAAKQLKIKAEEEEAAKLTQDAAKKKAAAAGIHVASAEDDKGTMEEMKAQAEAAKKDLEARKGRLGDIAEIEGGDLGFFKDTWASAKYTARYDRLNTTEARQLEMEGMERDRAAIDRYEQRSKAMPGRERERRERERLLGEAAGEEGKAGELYGVTIPTDRAELNADQASGREVGLQERLKAAREALNEGNKHAEELKKQAIEQAGHMVSASALQMKAMQEQDKFNAEVERLIVNLTKRTADLRHQ